MARRREDDDNRADGPAGDRVVSVRELNEAYRDHPAVNTRDPCPICSVRALHRQHCKELCLACGWYQSCVD